MWAPWNVAILATRDWLSPTPRLSILGSALEAGVAQR